MGTLIFLILLRRHWYKSPCGKVIPDKVRAAPVWPHRLSLNFSTTVGDEGMA
jgi:hypothetical protein